jgi:hypothetical protein
MQNLFLKITCKKDFAAAVYFSEAPTPPKLLPSGGQEIL